MTSPAPRLRVGLFVTCLINAMRPNVALAALHLLEKAGCEVDVPRARPQLGGRNMDEVFAARLSSARVAATMDRILNLAELRAAVTRYLRVNHLQAIVDPCLVQS